MRWKLHVRFGERAGETDQHERLTPRPGPTQPHRAGDLALTELPHNTRPFTSAARSQRCRDAAILCRGRRSLSAFRRPSVGRGRLRWPPTSTRMSPAPAIILTDVAGSSGLYFHPSIPGRHLHYRPVAPIRQTRRVKRSNAQHPATHRPEGSPGALPVATAAGILNDAPRRKLVASDRSRVRHPTMSMSR